VARRGGLGKGLGALIPPGGTEGAAAEVGGLDELPLASIKPNRFQPRDHFDEEALGLLADSIREVGVLQPVLVRPTGDDEYELIAGERRWRAARRVGLQTIPALVRQTGDAGALEQALVENVHRDNLNPLEEAAAYQQLIEDFGLTHDDVAARVGRSRATVTNTLRLMQLPPAIQKSVQQGKLSMGHARALLGTPDRAFQELLAKRVVDDDLSVRAVEDAVREHQGQAESAAPGDTAAEGNGSPARRRLRPPGLLELEELLGDHLETRVKISMGSSRGKVVVEFSTLEDLERIYRLMTGGGAVGSPATSAAAGSAG
jgi:ParB family chromosome partitioning protein